MSFDIALTGLNAVNQQLSTISNNIANTGTVGFKSSRTDFGSLYADTQAMGVEVVGNTQSISQGGSLTGTSRSLDLAISGGGFFVTRGSSGEVNYTRAGVFGLDKDNYVVNNLGQRLQGYTTDENNNIQAGTVRDLQLRSANLPAQATNSMDFVANLNADMDAPPTVDENGDPIVFDRENPSTYNSTYTTQVYDSLGREHTLTQYFIKTDTANEWEVQYFLDDADTSIGTATLTFNSDGRLTNGATQELTINPGAGAADGQEITINYTDTTQYGAGFAVTTNRADGYAAGEQTGLMVEDDGRVYVSYSNGQRLLQGQVVLANFANPEGLRNVSGTAWTETDASGRALIGVAGVGQFGAINSGALENSNVDLTQELVNLMEGQRNYQANTKVLSTEKELVQILFSAI